MNPMDLITGWVDNQIMMNNKSSIFHFKTKKKFRKIC